jgi:hypothetical protein
VIIPVLDTYPAQTVLARAQNLVSGYATYQASGLESVNTSASLAIYPSEWYVTTNFLERASLAELAVKFRARSTGRITFG